MKTKTYLPKKLIDGRVIGKEGWYIAIPNKGYKDCRITVFFGRKAMVIDNWNSAEAFRKFPDQWGSGFYILGYFKWAKKEGEPEQIKLI